MEYGITEKGFVKKTFQILRQELINEYKNIFGSDLDVSETSVAGQLINNQAYKFSKLWELAEATYMMFNPNSASGKNLDDLCARVGIARKTASKSIAYVTLRMEKNTTIPQNHIIKQTATNLLFYSKEKISPFLEYPPVMKTEQFRMEFSVNPQNNKSYSFRIQHKNLPVEFDIDFPSGNDNKTKIQILEGIKAKIDEIPLETIQQTFNYYIDYEKETFIIETKIIDKLQCFYAFWYDTSLWDYKTFDYLGEYICEEAKFNPIPQGSIFQTITNVSGLKELEIEIDGSPGSDEETDEELRQRRALALTGFGRATEEAIKSYLINNVKDITQVKVFSNRTDTENNEGMPPHSFECVVDGGKEEEIAYAIWNSMPAGIQSWGSLSIPIIDSANNEQIIKFSRPIPVYIWLKIELTFYNEEILPDDYELQILEGITSDYVRELDIGKDILLQRLYPYIVTIPGIKSCNILAGKSYDTQEPEYSTEDIIISQREIAKISESRIQIYEV